MKKLFSLILILMFVAVVEAGPITPDEIENVNLSKKEMSWILSITYTLKNDSGEINGMTKTFKLTEEQKDDVKKFLGNFLKELK